MTLLLKGVTVLLLTTFTTSFSTFSATSLSDVTSELLDKCQVDLTLDYWTQLENIPGQNLSREEVEMYLNSIISITACVIHNTAVKPDLRTFENNLLNVIENLVSNLVNNTDTYSEIKLSVQNLEVYISMVGSDFTSTDLLTFITSYASLDIDLVGISHETAGIASMVFISYTNMKDIFKPSFFDTNIDSNKKLMSAVISFSLPDTENTWIMEVIDFTLKHIQELDPRAILSCMNWERKAYEWPSCFVSQTNSTQTVCSCYYGTTFALISETDPCIGNSVEYCEEDFLFRMLYYIYSVDELPQETVKNYLTTTMNLMEHVKEKSTSRYYEDVLLYVNEILVFKLANDTDTYSLTNISLQTLDIQILVVGYDYTLNKTSTLITSSASMDIDLIGISEYTYDARPTSVALLSYSNLANILRADYSDTLIDSNKTIISTVVSAVSNNYFARTKPVNITLKHVGELNPEGILSCAHWNWYLWDAGHCFITQTNSTHTVCSCNQLDTVALFMLTISCSDNITAQCAEKFLEQISDNTDQELPEELVEFYLNTTISIMSDVIDAVSEQDDLISFGNSLLGVTKKLVSTLIEKTNFNITLQNLEVQVRVVGTNDLKILTLITSSASVDIDLAGISENIKGSVTVVFMSYNTMSEIFKPTSFKTIIDTDKTMMSTVVSVSVLQATKKTQLTKPINITFKHTSELKSESSLLCVYWNGSQWAEDDCDIIAIDTNHTACLCNRLGMFALIMETNPCRVDLTCATNFLNQIENIRDQELPEKIVKRYLNITIDLMTLVKSNKSYQQNLTNYGNAVLNINEKLVSTLVKKTTKNYYINFTLQNLEVQVSVNNISQLKTSNASLDIDLIRISRNNKGSAAVAFINYADMADILKPTNTGKTLVSTVVSATLPKTQNTWLTQPVNITFKHIHDLDPAGGLSCVYWMENEWVETGCVVIRINSSHTMCSCDHLSVFALIIDIVPCKTLFGVTVSLHCNVVLNMSIAQGVGVVFLSLCLLTFAFCCQNTNETNTALINLFLNLLLFNLLDLLKPLFQPHLQPPQACVIMIGIRWFLFISAFVWMFIETVLLFILLKNVSQIRSNQGQGHRWKWINMVGYLIPVVVVIVCAAANPQYSINEGCWENKDMDIFDIPVLFIVASNVLLYIIIITMMIFTLKQMRNENLHRRNTDNTDVIMRVMFKSLAQFIILGCYWILPYIPNDNVTLYNTFLFLKSQQGTFIFLVHCLLNQEVRQQYRKFLYDICCYKNPGTTTEVEMTQNTQH